MAKRSLKASPDGIRQAKREFTQKGWTQDYLAVEVNVKTRQPIWRFFTGQSVDRFIFMEICFVLGLNWREIAENPPAESPKSEEQKLLTIDDLVKQVRSQRLEKIQAQCGTIALLEITHPVNIDDIYVDVNIVEASTSLDWLDSADLRSIPLEEFDRFGMVKTSQKQIPLPAAVETYSKLRVLGRLGCGKTTFLQHLAIKCNQGHFASNRVPIFITLRDFAEESREMDEFSLLNYIRSEFLTDGISDPSVIETLLCEGRVLLLLDGSDELRNQDSHAVIKEIRRFSEKYQKNLFVVASRTAAAKTFTIKNFTDVEIAPFTSEQIVAFVSKWFAAFTKTQDSQEKAREFIENLGLLEQLELRGLVSTPLFLHLACLVFHRQEKYSIKETEFYKQCLDLMLVKWDQAIGIKRDEVYPGFLLSHKLKLLSQIAATTFEKGHYFFEQQVLEQYIGDYLRALPNAPTESEELQLDSEIVLKGIELQHGLLVERVQGIFSFSYLAIQEYFTARKIVACDNLPALEKSLKGLISHLTDPRWRKVFLLTAAMLRSADILVRLLKQEIDTLIAQDSYLQEFLLYSSQKYLTSSPQPKRLNPRALYLSLARAPLMTMLLQQRSLKHDWQFTPEQEQVLQDYYNANQLLLDCLNSSSEVTPVVQQKIELTFLLPPQELEKREELISILSS